MPGIDGVYYVQYHHNYLFLKGPSLLDIQETIQRLTCLESCCEIHLDKMRVIVNKQQRVGKQDALKPSCPSCVPKAKGTRVNGCSVWEQELGNSVWHWKGHPGNEDRE